MSRIYQNYHRHTFYTNPIIPDSTASNEDYALRAAELGHGILSTMEHGFQGNYYNCAKIAKKYDMKLLFGAEAYWVKDRTAQDSSNCHICICAKNEEGRKGLNDVLSEANLTGFYRRPRLDIPLILSLPPENFIVTTACVAYWKYDDIEQITEEFAKHFKENFYLEVQYHNTEKQSDLNRRILLLRDKLHVPLIMGCDSHYIKEEQAKDRDDFLASKEMFYGDEEGWFLDYPDGDVAFSRFKKQGVLSDQQIDEAMSNTNVFLGVEKYDDSIFDSEVKMPTIYPTWTQEQKDAEYERLVWNGWDLYKDKVPEDEHSHYIEEIRSEIDTVKQCGMSDYFILNHHIIKKGKENGGLLTKSGRGSAVSYFSNLLLGFTEVDRISAKVKMYPARFMSAERILQSGSLPDIDFNVAEQEPFALAQKQILGEDHAYPMISYGTMKNSAAWKLYAKSQGVPFGLANDVSEQIKLYEEAVKQADESEKEAIDPLDYIDKKYHEIFQKSADYRGIISSWSIAPCSYLLYQGSIRREIGLIRIKDHICCLMDGHWAEECHFLKNDLLKVSVVKLIYKSFRRIGMEPPSVNELIDMCPPEDPAWLMYSHKCCLGLNQVEKSGTSSRVAIYKPNNISELCAFVAAIRPGFKSMYKTFAERKEFSYGVDAFDSLLKTEELPQSFCLYQEQEMAALNYAGIPMSECYTAIKNIAKKRAEKVMEYKKIFLDGFKKAMVEDEGRTEEDAEGIAQNLWQIIEDSSRYSFNACVSGSTQILRPPAKANQFCPTVEEMYNIKNDDGYARDTNHWELHRKYKKYGYGAAFSFSKGRVVRHFIKDIRLAGTKPIYRLTTRSGAHIDCTTNHKFPTLRGEKELSALKEGDLIFALRNLRAGNGNINWTETTVAEERIESIRYLNDGKVFDVEMEEPFHTFITSTGIVTSNSHSYCVSADSLYCAWMKAHHPVEFYESLLGVYEEKGDKDKISAAKQEAERFFKIKFPPLRFGQDNRAMVGNPKSGEITTSIRSIKGFGAAIGDVLYECGNLGFDSFVDVVLWLSDKGIKKPIVDLIKIDYFKAFGNQRELMRILDVCELFKYGSAKKIKREVINDSPFAEVVAKRSTGLNADGSEAKSYTLLDTISIMRDCEKIILSAKLDDIDQLTKIINFKEVMGYIGYVSEAEEDRRKLYIKDIFPVKRKRDNKQFGWSVITQSIGSGKESRFTVFNGLYNKKPIQKGSIIVCLDWEKDGQYYKMTDYDYLHI